MSESDKKERKEFMLRFCKSNSMMLLKDGLSEILEKKLLCLFFDAKGKPIESIKKHRRYILDSLKKARKRSLKEVRTIECGCGKPCLYIPIIQGDNVYGYMLILHLKRLPEKREVSFIKSFIDLALKEFQKTQELATLYDTIRPRAIALSTIHTIHRLLTSTLDMDELIERIARLTLQVMRARHCTIMLLNDPKTRLIPKAVIDLKASSGGLHKKHKDIKLNNGAFGKVARTGKTMLSRNSIYVPLVEEDTIGVICAKYKSNNAPFNKFDLEILLTLAEQAVIAIKNAQMYEEQKKMTYGSIKSLGVLLDAKSPHMYTHSEEFVKITLAIAEEMKLPKEETRNLRYAALLPDTGKFSIPDEILKKQGGLSKEEFNVVKMRHLESLKVLAPLQFLKPVVPIITHHHERYDGKGYPDGLKGRQIPIGARIMAVADAFEAMVSSRPYKDTRVTIQQALKEIEKNSGTQFDPDVVNAFMLVTKKPDFKQMFGM